MPIVYFDLDGTLIDSRRDLAEAMNKVRNLHSLPELPIEVIIKFIGRGLYKFVEGAIPEITEEAQINQCCEEHKKFYVEHIVDNTRLYPGVKETLPKLHQRRKLVLVTNKPEFEARIILDRLGVAADFDYVVGGGSGIALKPNPEAHFHAAAQLGETMEGAWMVGDYIADMDVAKNAGIKACFCSFGIGNIADRRADAAISRFEDILFVLN